MRWPKTTPPVLLFRFVHRVRRQGGWIRRIVQRVGVEYYDLRRAKEWMGIHGALPHSRLFTTFWTCVSSNMA